jgi:effector-binding domain-containing protein
MTGTARRRRVEESMPSLRPKVRQSPERQEKRHETSRRALLIGAAAVIGLTAADRATGQTTIPVQESTPRPDSLQPGDAFGEEVMLTEQTIIYVAGSGKWDNAFETIVNAFKTVNDYLTKAGIKPSGPPMTIYTATNDTSFQFQAALPLAEAPKDKPAGDITVGKTTAGRAFKFIHRGSYDDMDTTYDAITNFLDEKQLDATGLFVEKYLTDPVTTAEDKLVVEVYVPVK